MELAQSVSVDEQRPRHALLFPFPLQGHIKPFMNLAKVLSSRGFYITFVNTEFVQERLAESGGPMIDDSSMNIRFETVPDGLPAQHGRTHDITDVAKSMEHNAHIHLRQLMKKLQNRPDIPPVSFIVSDGVLSKLQNIANDYGVPRIAFWTTSACGFMLYFFMPQLIEEGYLPLKDEGCLTEESLDEVIITCIPGMPPLRLKELPSFCLVTDPSDFFFQNSINQAQGTLAADGLILNTFDELEGPVLQALSLHFPVCAIGPLLLSQSLHCKGKDGFSDELSMWKEERSCLTWLDTRKPCSVMYVCLGSLTVLSNEQLLEFAWGLASSNQSFLWVIRPDIVHGESAILPEEFLEETKDRGLLVEWAPQIKVLSHQSVGGFLTHSGWNSTLESISAGVPMICWPFFAEQQTNAKFVCEEWGIGMHLKKTVRKRELALLVRNFIKGEGANGIIRRRIGQLKEIAKRAVQEKGSSHNNLDKLLSHICIKRIQQNDSTRADRFY
eukprot:PITA_22103